jgi:hypothetical protein
MPFPHIPGTAWFGPKRIGWGVSPRSLAGWIVTALMVISVVAVVLHNPQQFYLALIPVAIFAVIAALTYDSRA